ncbi:MAG: sodium:calcium antiporter [Candidatus Helarchaeota archaeon]|nr:sodium:calcium antiporter [Candidatus Helarchaeota archaeon]
MMDLATTVIFLIVGSILMIYASNVAVNNTIILACKLGIPSLFIGLTLVSLGTDLPEIVNSIMSSYIGHANLDIGDSIGSVLTQLTLVLGLLPFIGRSFTVKRKEILIMGGCLVLALIIIMSIVEKGYFTWINGLLLVGTWPIYLLLTDTVVDKDKLTRVCLNPELHPVTHRKIYHVILAVLGFIGVAVGVTMIITGVLEMSRIFNMPDFIISFFIVSIGTSLPELVVDIGAIKKGEVEVAIGDIIGSCIIDASFAIGIGQMLFPNEVSADLIVPAILYVIIASIGVIFILSCRQKVDKKAGIVLIALYLLSYALLLIIRTTPAFDITSLITIILIQS